MSDIWSEIADLVVSGPDRETLIAFRPSPATQERARELLGRLKAGTLTEDERAELDEFTRAECFLRLVKARARAKRH